MRRRSRRSPDAAANARESRADRMIIVGLNAYHGDVAAAVLRDGALVAAIEEERFCRIKHVAGFPARAIETALAMAGATPADVDVWAIARGRRVHLLRKAWFALTHRPGAALFNQYRSTAGKNRHIPEVIAQTFGLRLSDVDARATYVEHHPAHLASAYYTSGMQEAACCAIDGFGDFVSVSVAHGRGGRMDVIDRTYFPHSLGLLYLAITQHLGFKKYGDEYKVMGLAPYGTPAHTDAIQTLVHLEPGGRFSLDLECFRHWTGEISMTWDSGEPQRAGHFHRPADRSPWSRAPARRTGRQAPRRHRRVRAAGVRRGGLSRAARRARARAARHAVPRRRLRDEQRRQRQDPATHAVQERVHSTRGRRQRHRAWRGTAGVACRRRSARRRAHGSTPTGAPSTMRRRLPR